MNAPGPWVTIRARARRVVTGDVHLPGENDAQAGADLADLGERLAGRKRVNLAEPPDALDLSRVQRGKHLVVARVDDRWHGSLAAMAS
jgi:hypothetical protein